MIERWLISALVVGLGLALGDFDYGSLRGVVGLIVVWVGVLLYDD